MTISVHDTGPGIPEAIVSHICDPRFTTKPNAAGMGLYVARTVLELHGGGVRVERPSRGATFHLDVPAHADA